MKTPQSKNPMMRLYAGVWSALMACSALTAVPPPVFAAPTVTVSQIPLTVSQPAHPQVLFALGNSQSMDGTLSGAIMTGSGALGTGGGLSLLQNTVSPVSFTIPSGFTPPIDPGSAGVAPYTVVSGGLQYDNSPSRLNIAKAGIAAILSQYLAYADFGMVDYSTSGVAEYATWVYQMSPLGVPATTPGSNFVFTSVQQPNTEYIPNPCNNYTSLPTTTTVYANCANIAAQTTLSTGDVNLSTYIQVGPVGQLAGTPPANTPQGSSDDPLINDVLYAPPGYQDPICLDYNGPFPANPYTAYSLGTYNSNINAVSENYFATVNSCVTGTTPTNAGFVPYSPEVLYALRGYGYYGNQSATGSTTIRPMTTASPSPTLPPTQASVNAVLSNFSTYLAPETNTTGTNEIKASAVQSPTYGLLKGALDYYTSANPATSNNCLTKRYVVLVTDGLPTMDKNGNTWPPPGTISATNWAETVNFNPDGSLNTATTNDQAVLDAVTALNNLYIAPANSHANASIKTYIIGVGAGVDPSQNPTAASVLTAMAIAGGTGSYFKATSPGDLTNDMQQILASILAETGSTSSVSLNSTGINTKSVVYQAQFTTSDTNQDWTGNLLAYPISDAALGTVSSTPNWAAQSQLDAQNWDTGRLITTWDPVANAGIPFRWTGGTPLTHIATSTVLGQKLMTFTPDTNGQDVLQFLRGNPVLEQRFGGQFRNRTHKLGDIVDSAPLYIAAPSAQWQQASYASFQATYANRAPVIYAGANDGMLHAFDASTNPTAGNELFAFIPNGVYNNLINLVSPYYNGAHMFFVDGSPQAQDVQFADNSWHTVLVSGERAGGMSIFAMDVTNPSGLTSEAQVANSVLWEFTDANMGYTFSTPTISYTAAGFVTFFGNGYDSPTGAPYLYALNPQTGAVLSKINLCAAVLPNPCSATAANGLSSVTVTNTSGSLGVAQNVLYAGDLQGNLWRVDISDPNPSNWSVSVLFQARDASNNPQPITVTPAVTLNPRFPVLPGTMVYFGTGQYLGTPDALNTSLQTVYGVYDNGSAPGTPLTRANLQVQTLSTTTTTNVVTSATVSVRLLTGNPVPLPTMKGWYVDLSLASGERVVTDPQLFNGTLQLVSYQPGGSLCTAGGNSWYMVFNFATGGATAQPQFDVNGDNTVNSADKIGGQVAAGMEFTGYLSSPTLMTGSASGGQAYLSQTKDLGTTCTGSNCDGLNNVAQANNSAKGAWQEIRK